MDWNKIWNDIVTFFENNIWNIVLFFAVLLLGIIVIKLIINITRRLLNKTRIEKITIGFLMVVLKICLYLVLLLALLSIIGIQITGILTALSAMLLAIGLALENIIANAANGLVIVSNKMFKKGDYISVDGVEGSVTQINFLFTTILTSDNKRITIPNSTIVNSSVVDYDSAKTRRVDITFSVAYESDVEQVKKLILDCMKSNGKVLLNPEPFCRLNALKNSSIEFIAKCWCDREDYWDVYYDVLELVYNELKKNKISIPYDQIEVRERNDVVKLPYKNEDIPQRVEKERKMEQDLDLENMDLSKIFHKRKKTKKEKKQDKKKEKSLEKDNKDNNKTDMNHIQDENIEIDNEKENSKNPQENLIEQDNKTSSDDTKK